MSTRLHVRLAVVLACAIAAPAVPSIALADESAAALKQRGDAAMDSLRYDDAIAAYEQAYALSKDPAILYNLGRVHQARGEYPKALEYLQRFDREAPPELKGRVPLLASLIAEIRAKVAFVTVSSNVAGARVLVRDQVVGTTPLAKPVALVAGPATVEVDAEGYAPFRRSVELTGGGAVVIDAQLLRPERSGILVVRASGGIVGSVTIDGKRAGNTPVEVSVAAGSHTIAVRAEGKSPTETQAVVAAGERKEIEVTLTSPAPITGTWWFWTGVGAVVVGGAVLTYALLTERKADTGDKFGPTQVSAPLVHW